jgi:lysine biosynthesis protein LysW
MRGKTTMNNGKRTVTAPCPDCGHVIYLGSTAKKEQKITCPNCWAYLEVISVEPLELEWDEALIGDEEDYEE